MSARSRERRSGFTAVALLFSFAMLMLSLECYALNQELLLRDALSPAITRMDVRH